VRINKTGENELAGGSDDFGIRRSGQIGTDLLDHAVFVEDVPGELRVGSGDGSVVDEQAHDRLLRPDFAIAVAEPAGSGGFALGVELDAFLALEVQVAEERIVPTTEWKVGEGSRDAYVDANHAGAHVSAEFAGGLAGVGKNRSFVSECLTVRGGDRLVERLRAHHGENGTEGLRFHERVGLLDMVDERRTEEKSTRRGVDLGGVTVC